MMIDIEMKKYLTKEELQEQVDKGILPEEYKPRDIGQGYGYKIDSQDVYKPDFDENIVIYIPEFSYDVMDNMPEDAYTLKDFIEICNGDREQALDLFESVDWQYPETLYSEWENEK